MMTSGISSASTTPPKYRSKHRSRRNRTRSLTLRRPPRKCQQGGHLVAFSSSNSHRAQSCTAHGNWRTVPSATTTWKRQRSLASASAERKKRSNRIGPEKDPSDITHASMLGTKLIRRQVADSPYTSALFRDACCKATTGKTSNPLEILTL
jgi:hypothetical protein